MVQEIDLRDVERRAWSLYFEDGLWDIFLGLLFIGGGLRSLTGSLWWYLLVAGGILVLILGKRWITLPRLGQIHFSAQRKARTNVVRAVALGAMIFTAVVLIAAIFGGQRTDFPAGWIFVFLVPGVFLLMAYMMDFKRLYGYAVLIAGFMILSETIGGPAASWAQIVAGIVPLVVGVSFLFRFLNEYPVIDEAALLDEAGDGRSQ